jgi:hypothetical protein
MKKLLFLTVIGFGGAMLVKGGHVVITPNNQVTVAGYQVPLPDSVQNSPVMGIVASMVRMQVAPQATAADQRVGPAPPARPALPNVTSAAATYNANAPSAGPANGSDQLSAVAKALR